MRITRFLLPGCFLAAFAGPVGAQYPSSSGTSYRDLVPSVRPVAAEEPVVPTDQLVPSNPVMPPYRRPTSVNRLEQMAAPQTPGPDPMGTLTGQPAPPVSAVPGLPPGSYPSPYFMDAPGCCGPLGGDGRIGYEIYEYAGTTFVFGPGLPKLLHPGWNVGGGARTLIFDPTHTAAWTVDLGLSFTRNWGYGGNRPEFLNIRQQTIVNQTTGVVTPQPDLLVNSGVRGVSRLSFNYNIGRDIWLLGSGNTGGMETTNVRVGGWVGGRYGSAHIDVVPFDVVHRYARRQNVFEGIAVGGHVTCEVPLGAYIFFGGLRVEYTYDWTNLAPPIQGNINSINLQGQWGIRF